MAKFNLSRLFEVSKYISTPAGAQLKDALEYISSLATETVRNLKQGLTFADNFDSEVKLISVLHNIETTVLPSKRTAISQVLIRRSLDPAYYVIDSYGWIISPSGALVVKVGFEGSPPATASIPIEILILYG